MRSVQPLAEVTERMTPGLDLHADEHQAEQRGDDNAAARAGKVAVDERKHDAGDSSAADNALRSANRPDGGATFVTRT